MKAALRAAGSGLMQPLLTVLFAEDFSVIPDVIVLALAEARETNQESFFEQTNAITEAAIV